MKTIYKQLFIVVLFLFTLANLHGSVIQLPAPYNIQTIANTVNDGDIIELTTSGGSYTWSAQVTVTLEKAITIRAKAGLANKPVITFTGTSGAFLRYNSTATTVATKTWTFEGISFNGYNGSTYYAPNFILSVIAYPAYGINIEVNNCNFTNFGERAFHFTGSAAPTTPTIAQGGNLTILNSEFRNIGVAAINSSTSLSYTPDNIILWNNLFYGTSTNFVNSTKPGFNSYIIDHCTFVNSTQRELQLASTNSSSYIKNSLFVNSVNASVKNIYNVNIGADCGIYYTSTGTKSSIYPFSILSRVTNPVIDANTGLAGSLTYTYGTTDGLPTGYFGKQVSVSERELNNLNYTSGNGPSTTKSFIVSAVRLTNNLTITAPGSFEVSTNQNSGFSTSITLNQSGGSILATTIYVRLKSGLTDSYYSGTVNINSTGAASQSLKVSGSVSNKPTVFTSLSSLSGFSYNYGSGPSLQQYFTVNAVQLTGSLIVTAPTGFEISLNSGISFIGATSLNIANSGGLITNLNIYVRQKSSLAAGNYSGNINLSSTNADTKTVSLSGIVNPAPAIITANKTAITNFNYSFGNGPSTIQSFTVNGSGLTSNIKITAPANYEISFLNGTSFSGNSTLTLNQNSGNVSLSNIYVRLRKDRAVGTYDEKILIESTNATTKEINLSGFVTEATGISTSVSSLNGFEYIVYNGPSAEKSFDITGVNLISSVIISAPANYEISTTNGADFSGSGQILIDQSTVNGQILRIYMRLIEGLNLGSYNGTLTVSSSGATTKSISITGNVYNPLVIATDPAYYNPMMGGGLTLTSKWLLSKNTNNYTYGNELIAASGMARDMTVRNGKMLFVDRGNKQIVIVNGESGLKETALPLNTSLFSYIGRNNANTADSTYLAGSLQFYSIKTDDAGNVLVGNQITSNTGRFQIYKIDMTTGSGTLLIDQANLASLFPTATNLRFDFFSVQGDVNTNATILAANGYTPSMEVYKWTISNGLVSAPTLIRLDNTTSGTDLSGLESPGAYPRTYFSGTDKFYIDGGSTYPTIVNMNGAVTAGFYQRATALTDSITSAGNKWVMNPGNNGVCEFKINDQNFMISSATLTTGVPPSAFRLFKFADNTKLFTNIDCMWTFPQNGMGTSSNSYRTALPIAVVNGNSAKIYVYCGENGYAMYELNYDPVSTSTRFGELSNFRLEYLANKISTSEMAKSISVYSIAGLEITSAKNTNVFELSLAKGIYIVKAISIKNEQVNQKIIVQ